VSSSAEYNAAVLIIRGYFASTQGFLLESVSFSTPDLVTTQVTLVMSVTGTSTIDVVISQVTATLTAVSTITASTISVTQYTAVAVRTAFTVSVVQKVVLTVAWSADLADSTSAAFQAQANIVQNAYSTSTAFTTIQTMSIQTVVVRSFRIVTVTAGRKRRAGDDIEADIDISGEADSADVAAIETAVESVSARAAEESAVLDGAPTISTVKKSSASKFIASIVTLAAVLLL